MSSIIALLLMLAAFWFWFDSLRSREIALTICRQMCLRYDVQLLDQTIGLHKVRLSRNSRGQIRVLRYYRFDFSNIGDNREQGSIVMLGSHPALFELPGHDKLILPV